MSSIEGRREYPIKIVLTSFYETYSKKNTKNYNSNYYVLVFLISVNLRFFAYKLGWRKYIFAISIHLRINPCESELYFEEPIW